MLLIIFVHCVHLHSRCNVKDVRANLSGACLMRGHKHRVDYTSYSHGKDICSKNMINRSKMAMRSAHEEDL